MSQIKSRLIINIREDVLPPVEQEEILKKQRGEMS